MLSVGNIYMLRSSKLFHLLCRLMYGITSVIGSWSRGKRVRTNFSKRPVLQVVCSKARRDAGDSFIKMLGDSEFEPPVDQLVCSDPVCRVGKLY